MRKELIARIRRRERVSVDGLTRPAAALLVSLLAASEEKRVVVVTPGAHGSAPFLEDLNYFMGGGAQGIPPYETLPFEREEPDQATAAERMAALGKLLGGTGVFVCSSSILGRSLPPPRVLGAFPEMLARGGQHDPQELGRRLEHLGYRRVPLVEGAGDFSIRGHVVDVFSPGWERPLRLDFLGDQVEEMTWFDPADQRSVGAAGSARLLPAREIFGEGVRETFLARAAALCPDYRREGSPLAFVADELADLGPQPWHATLLPLFYDPPATLFDYCPPGTLLVLLDAGEVARQARAYLEAIRFQGAEEGYGPSFVERFVAESSAGLRILEQGKTSGLRILDLDLSSWEGAGGELSFGARPLALAPDGGRGRRSWLSALERIKASSGRSRPVFVCRTAGSARRLVEICREHDLGVQLREEGPFDPAWLEGEDRAPVAHVGTLREGFSLESPGVVFVTEDDLFGRKHRQQQRRAARSALLDLDFSSLREGDYLVHEDQGIGRYGGLVTVGVDGGEQEMLILLYAEGGRLYVPMDRLHLVQKYLYGEGHAPRVDRLGGTSWERSKQRTRRAVQSMVKEMLRLQAKRQAMAAHAFKPDDSWQREFEASFEYEETPDQWRAIEDVKQDMESPRPMDRLVCGDVGYGKTEVALRAAFKAVSDGKQVAVLAPTTVLCQQHHITFSARFAPFPVRVEELSRFTSRAAQAKALEGIADGRVDIVIGTHRLLQGDVVFRDLGLLVIDEEHRFGVKDKERLKDLKASVDVLSLSATPIPRTFYMAMSGMRDLSVIETPPMERRAVKTRILPFSEKVVREAVRRELARGGQVFFLHNRIKSMPGVARNLETLLPEARLAVAHGQMSEGKLKEVMDSFRRGDHDMLLSTSIVESGLDIPNANTMIIDRADRYGLADLYQLRGRIGRSSHQAYAYLLVPGGRLTEEARRRLTAIEEFGELGSGVKVAAMDLEIRGAGNLLGYQQSGRMAEVGLEMYTRLLEEAYREMTGHDEGASREASVEIIVPFPAGIREEYIPDENQRLAAYKRLSLVGSQEELERVVSELADIFGRLPLETAALIQVCALRIAARDAGVKRIAVSSSGADVWFDRTTRVEPGRVLELIGRERGAVRLVAEDQLRLALPPQEPVEVLARLRNLLLELLGYGTVPPARGGVDPARHGSSPS